MIMPEPPAEPRPASARGLRCARWIGRALGLALIAIGVNRLLGDLPSAFPLFQALYFLAFGAVLNLPFRSLPDAAWKPAYAALVLLAAGFVFVMVADVMFAYMAAAERGERLGVPGLQGTLVFIALLQPPVVLFRRRPDLLD